MGEKPGQYWDHDECRWVKYEPNEERPVVPTQAGSVEDEEPTVVGVPI